MTPTAPPVPSPDAMFGAFANRFVAEYLERFPVDATIGGEHRFDATWPDLSVAGDAALRQWAERHPCRDPAR